mmetsp:Transcript_142710/g.362368  ORF Transcript_142710/g.362368 Transcript_142710/m.362368 type:complete len:280 (+) Transcript_142710:494-1333(+)
MFKPRSGAVWRKIADKALEMQASLVSVPFPPAPLPRPPIAPSGLPRSTGAGRGCDAGREDTTAADAFWGFADAAKSPSMPSGGKTAASPMGCGGSLGSATMSSATLVAAASHNKSAPVSTSKTRSKNLGGTMPGVNITLFCDRKKGMPLLRASRKFTHTTTSESHLMPEITRLSPGACGAKCTWFRNICPSLPPALRPCSKMSLTCRLKVPWTHSTGRSVSSTLRRRINSSSFTTFIEWPCTARMYAWPSASRLNSNLCLSLACTICCKSASMALNLLT